MRRPPGHPLTPVQFEIMQAVWDAPAGASVTEIWEQITKRRRVGRTTVLNLVLRLEQRGWLKRRKADGTVRYLASIDRSTTTANAAAKFVDDFFGGSATELVMSILGSKRVSKSELDELRKLVDQARDSSRRT